MQKGQEGVNSRDKEAPPPLQRHQWNIPVIDSYLELDRTLDIITSIWIAL